MEYSLRESLLAFLVNKDLVLILVLMEYGLRGGPLTTSSKRCSTCLNPCFNGIWSASEEIVRYVNEIRSLNPCFNGIWSARVKSVRICVWALYDQKDRRNRKFRGKTCTSECKYTKVFRIDCTTCHLYLTIFGFSGIFHRWLRPCQGVTRLSLSGECDTLAGSLILKGTLVSRGLRHFVPRHAGYLC